MTRKLSAMTREELKAALSKAGLDTRGLKADLLERWENHLKTLQEEETNSQVKSEEVPPTKEEAENDGKDDVEQMNYAALRTALKDLGFATTGNTSELRNRLKAAQTNGEATPKGARSLKKKVLKSPPVASLFSISSNVIVEDTNEEEEEKKRTERMQKSRAKRQLQSSTSSTNKKEKIEKEEENPKTKTSSRSSKREKIHQDGDEIKATGDVQESAPEIKPKGGRRKKIEENHTVIDEKVTQSKQEDEETTLQSKNESNVDRNEENESKKDVIQEENPKKSVGRRNKKVTAATTENEEEAMPPQSLESKTVLVKEAKPKKITRRTKETSLSKQDATPSSSDDVVEEVKSKKTARRKEKEEAVQSIEPEEEKPKRSQRKKEETEKMVALKASKLLKPVKTTKKKTVNGKQSEDINLIPPENSSTVTPLKRRRTGPKSKTPQIIYNPDSVSKKTSEDSVSKPSVEDFTEKKTSEDSVSKLSAEEDQLKTITQVEVGEKKTEESNDVVGVETVVKPVIENFVESVVSTDATTEEEKPMEIVESTNSFKDVPKETIWMKTEVVEAENSLQIPPGIQFPTLVRPSSMFETVIIQPDNSNENMEVEISEKEPSNMVNQIKEETYNDKSNQMDNHVVAEFVKETVTETVIVEMKKEVIIVEDDVEEKQDTDENKKEELDANMQEYSQSKEEEKVSDEKDEALIQEEIVNTSEQTSEVKATSGSSAKRNEELAQKEDNLKTTKFSEPGSSYFQSSIAGSEFSYVTALEGEDSKKDSFASVQNLEPSKEQEQSNLPQSMEKQLQPANVQPQQQEEIIIQTPAKDDNKNDDEELYTRLEIALLEATVGGITEADFEVYDAILSSFVQERPANQRAVHFEQSPSLNGSFLNIPATPAVAPFTTSALAGGWLSAAPTPIRPPANVLNWQFSQKIPSRRPPVPLFSPQLTQESRQFSSPTVTAPKSAVKSKQLLQLQEFLREEERSVDKQPKFASSPTTGPITTTTTQPIKSATSIPRPQFIFSPPSTIAGNKAVLNVRKDLATNSNNVSNYSFD